MRDERNRYDHVIRMSESSLVLRDIGNGNYVLEIVELATGRMIARTVEPIRLYLFDGIVIKSHGRAYAKVEDRGDVLIASAVVTLEDSTIQVTDCFTPSSQEDGVELTREVMIHGRTDKKAGFFSAFELSIMMNGEADFYWFAPGVWYHDNRHVPAGSIGSPGITTSHDGIWANTEMVSNVIREDRLPLPIFMCFDRVGRRSLTFIHSDAGGSTTRDDDTERWVIDERLQFGSLGERHEHDRVWMCFWYPGTEGDVSYPPMWSLGRGNLQSQFDVNPFEGRSVDPRSDRWSFRFHPIQSGVRHQYRITILYRRDISYIDSLRRAWRVGFSLYNPTVREVDLRKVQSLNLQVLSQMVRYNDSCDDTECKAVGIPTWIECFSGRTGKMQNTFAIGFVGRNLEAARLLLNAGRDQGNSIYVKQGLSILDFWVRCSGMGLSHTEFDVLTGRWVDGGTTETGQLYVFLRQESEGHHTCLQAWESEKRRGIDHPDWFEWVKSYADWLADYQNPDGSFYRSYTLDGRPYSKVTSDCTYVIEFLLDMARITGIRKYSTTAYRTAHYLYENFHHEGHFIGGTLDNPNCYDKEACILALEAYLKLYEVTNDSFWLNAAELAATFAETWIYMWNVPMPADDANRFYPSTWTTVGLQLITTGVSAVDMYMSRNAWAFARLARLTGDSHYKRVAEILHFNTKGVIQLERSPGAPGYFGYAFPGLQIEHWGMGRGRGFGLNSGWLPWCATGNLVGLGRMEKEHS